MKAKTIEEMIDHQDYENNLDVTIDIPNVYKFDGKIVGISSRNIIPIYIVECTDGFLPNETYPYKVAGIPMSYIFPKK